MAGGEVKVSEDPSTGLALAATLPPGSGVDEVDRGSEAEAAEEEGEELAGGNRPENILTNPSPPTDARMAGLVGWNATAWADSSKRVECACTRVANRQAESR